MKIFIGSDDIASVLSGLSEGFKDLGHEVTTFVFSKNKFYEDIEYDIISPAPLNFLLKKNFPQPFTSAVSRLDRILTDTFLNLKTDSWIKAHDLFIFIWRPWINEETLFKRIKKAGKQIICVHLGSDVRHISSYKQEFNEDVSLWEKFFHQEDLNEKIKKIRLHELYADVIYSVPDQAGLYIRPFNHVYLPIGKKKNINYNIPARKEPVIIHAPSRSGIKGTRLILDSIEKLKTEGYKFTFNLLENIPNDALLQKLSDADILVDELLLHGPGVLSGEAMLSGCAVATKTLSSNKNIFDPPVLSISSDTIYYQLKFLLDNFNYRIELAEKGYRYASTHNNPLIISKNMLSDLSKNESDYTPTFYMEKYSLENSIVLTQENRKLSSILASRYFGEKEDIILRASKRGLVL